MKVIAGRGFPWIVLFILALAVACGPLGGSSEPPPYLELSAASVTFDAGEDSHLIELKNTGGGVIPFTALVSAESGGVTWLQAEPAAGTLEGGTSKAVLLTVTNREALLPGTYSGQVSIEAENAEGRSLLVSMTVGQPIIETDPVDALEYGTTSFKSTLLVTNVGDGTLLYSVLLPGPWITSSEALQRALSAGQTDSLVLDVDRSLVPWYGAGEDEILVTSNGLNDATHAPTVKLAVRVTTDANCGTDTDCTLPGYFCDDADGDGVCALRRNNGAACLTGKQCQSAICADGICCNSSCEGACTSCALAATKGTCSPVADGTGCDDGLVCTDGDACEDGACAGGPAMDCATFDNPCGPGACSESAGGCAGPELDDRCVIDGDCLDDGEWHPEVPCLRCLPGVASDDWSIIPDRCHVDWVCYETGDEIEGPCTLCDPATPDSATAVADETPCMDDGNPCTEDHCLAGACEHPGLTGEACEDADPCTHTDVCSAGGGCAGTPYVCDDGLDCTTDACLGDGGCSIEVAQDACVIDDICVADGAFSPGSGGCALCAPGYAQDAWTPQPDGLSCDDGDLCTENDSCLEGLCVAQVKNCDDMADCSEDSCVAGECVHDIAEQSCLIGDACYDEGFSSPDSPCQACLPDQSQEAWSGYNVGTPCDLPNAVAQCSEDGDCVLIDCVDTIHGDCNEISSDGCEVELWQDLMHCGACDDPCTRPNAWTACAGGQCSFVACHDGYTSCDGEETTGCEAHTASDPTNCGECGLLCDTSNPAKVGVCEDGGCGLVFCDPDTFNLDGDPANGCECAVDGEELCNDTDDDCDGEVDEGFDLASDLENCGACGVACDLPDVAAATCVNGACLIQECPPDLYDRNGDPLDGCEHTLLYSGEIWVDAINGGGPDADGSQEHPFASLQAALDAALPSNRIHLLQGSYQGGVVVDQVGLVIRGAGADEVQISTPDDATGITVTADDVAIVGMTIAGGSVGIHFLGDAQEYLEGGLVADAVVDGLTWVAETPGEVAGVRVEYATGVSVSMTMISDLTGGTTGTDLSGDPVTGVALSFANDAVVAGCHFSGLTGGKGLSYTGGCSCSPGCAYLPSGGLAVGIAGAHSPGLVCVGNTGQGITGGTGADQYSQNSSRGVGGVAAGVHLTASPQAYISGNSFDDLSGGPGGGSWTEFAAQQGFGLYLHEDSLSAQVPLDNSVNGDLIIFLSGATEVTVEDLTLDGLAQPTNLGKIVVVDSQGITIRNNTISQSRGETGATTYKPSCGGYVFDPGEPAGGIHLRGCTDCAVTGNNVTDVLGGRGGCGIVPSSYYCSNMLSADGGPGTGIEAVDCVGLSISGNSVGQITGQAGGHGCGNTGGAAAAFVLVNSTDVSFHNNIAADIKTFAAPGQQTNPGLAAGVRLEDTGALAIDHLTCVGVGDEDSPGYGILLGDVQLAQVSVRNSIFSAISRFGAKGLAGFPGMLSVYYSAFHDCSEGLSEDSTLVSSFEADPLFVLAEEGNLYLQPGSPCIDAGNPSTDCSLEPVPNGCAVNLGAYGNTEGATSAAGADHCSPCP